MLMARGAGRMDGLVAPPDQETPVLPKETTRQHAVTSNSEITFEPHTHKYTSHIPPSNTRMHQHTAHTHARKHTAHTHTHTHTHTHRYISHTPPTHTRTTTHTAHTHTRTHTPHTHTHTHTHTDRHTQIHKHT